MDDYWLCYSKLNRLMELEESDHYLEEDTYDSVEEFLDKVKYKDISSSQMKNLAYSCGKLASKGIEDYHPYKYVFLKQKEIELFEMLKGEIPEDEREKRLAYSYALLGSFFEGEDNQRSKYLLRKGIDFFESLEGDMREEERKRVLARNYGKLASTLFKKDDRGSIEAREKEVECLNELERDEKVEKELAFSCHYLTLSLMNGNFSKEMKYLDKKADLFEELEGSLNEIFRKKELARAYSHIGYNLKQIGKFEDAVDWKKKEIELYKSLEGSVDEDYRMKRMCMSGSTLANCLYKIGEEDLEWMKDSFEWGLNALINHSVVGDDFLDTLEHISYILSKSTGEKFYQEVNSYILDVREDISSLEEFKGNNLVGLIEEHGIGKEDLLGEV